MNGITFTKHFNIRRQQRGFTDVVVDALLEYGDQRTCHKGVESLIFTKAALAQIRNECSRDIFHQCEKRKNAYLIVSDGHTVITVARSYRKTVH